MANKVVTFKELLDAFIKRYGVAGEIVEGQEPAMVTVEDGTQRPNWALVEQQFLGNANVYLTYEEGLEAVGDNGFFAVANYANAYQVGYIVKNGEVSELGRIPGAEEFNKIISLSKIIDFSDDEYAIKVVDQFGYIGLGLRWDGTFEINDIVAKSSISVAGLNISAGNENSELAITITDSSNRPVFGIGWTGRMYILSMYVQESLGISGSTISAGRSSEFIHCIEDARNRVAFGIGPSGTTYVSSLYVGKNISADTIDARNILIKGKPISDSLGDSSTSNNYPKNRPLSGLNYINFNGQSQQEGSVSTVILSGHDTPMEGVYTARGNVKTRHLGDDVSATEWDMVGLHETVNGRNAETPATSAGLAIKRFYPDEIDKTFKMYILNSSVGGKQVGKWAGDNSELWRYFKNSFDSAVRHANELDMRLNVPIWNWWQGGSDEQVGTSKSVYLNYWYDLYNRFRQLIADHRGVPVEYIDLPIFLVQTNNYANYGKGTGGVSEAHLQISYDLEKSVICPSYHLTPAIRSNYEIEGDKLVPKENAEYDPVHNDNISYSRMGIYSAIALREMVVNGDPEFKGVKPKRFSVNGRHVAIEFYTTYGALQFWDGPAAAPITDVENNGFSAIDGDGEKINLTSVAIANDNTVVISIDRDWMDSDTVQYAVIGNEGIGSNRYGRFGYGRGKLWDHGADRGDVYEVGGDFYEFNWPCVQFWKKIGEF